MLQLLALRSHPDGGAIGQDAVEHHHPLHRTTKAGRPSVPVIRFADRAVERLVVQVVEAGTIVPTAPRRCVGRHLNAHVRGPGPGVHLGVDVADMAAQ